MHGWKELNRAIDSWVGANFGRHDSAGYATYLDRKAYWTANKQAEKLAEHGSGRTEFGMSKAAGCTRAVSLKAAGHEEAPFGAGTRWTFEIGHDMESSALALLEMIGCTVVAAQAEVVIDGLFRSWTDGIVTMPESLGGETLLLSVKSTGYKGSMKQRGNYIRRGFPELPFEGVKMSQPSWWAQAQLEMRGHGKIQKELVMVLAKDTIGSLSDDPYLIESGSMFVYTELIEANPLWVDRVALKTWREVAADTKAGGIARPYVLQKATGLYAELNPADNNWEPNASTNGGWNPCNYCSMFASCSVVTHGEVRERVSSRTARYGRKTNNVTTTNVSTN